MQDRGRGRDQMVVGGQLLLSAGDDARAPAAPVADLAVDLAAEERAGDAAVLVATLVYAPAHADGAVLAHGW